ncbi:MAG: transglycosylase SLT domain-containing protein [Candidatus Dormibacteraeota bacterium]|nr:transglycosylase SLT domain-containing protein [Candidatus Dormibacteraeota bacterium]
MASDWAARSVLRYRRLRNRLAILSPTGRRFRPSLALLSHVVVLGIGVVLVLPALTGRAAVTQAQVAPSSAYVLWISPVRARNALEYSEAYKSPTLGEPPPAPAPVVQPADPVQAPVHMARPAPTPAPTPKPAVVPPPGSGGDGLAAIYAVFGNSPGLSWALRVANCESHYNPLAVNRSSGASGLFQFMPSTWNANFPGQNIWDPMAQARGALVFYNAGRQSAWTCR